MLFDAILTGFYSSNNEEREAAEQSITTFRNNEPNQYIVDLIGFISQEFEKLNESEKQLHYRVQYGAIILLRQFVLSPDFFESGFFSLNFLEQLWALLLLKMESTNEKTSQLAAEFYGASLGSLITTGAYPQLIDSFLEILQKAITDSAFERARKLLLSLKSLLDSYSYEKMSRIVIVLFQTIFQLLQIPQILDESMDCLVSFAHDLSIVLNNNYNSDGTSLNESFTSSFITFMNYLFECFSNTESDNRDKFYKCWRIFFKHLSIRLVKEFLERVLLVAVSDIATSNNSLVLLSAIRFAKACFLRSSKARPSFMTFAHFDAFLMPSIRVFSMINLDQYELSIDSGEAIEYYTPPSAILQFLGDLTEIFQEHAPKLFIPLIIHYSAFLSGQDVDNSSSFYPITDQNVSIMISLFLLQNLISRSTDLPPIDFIVSLFQVCLTSQSNMVRYYTVYSLSAYLKRELNYLTSNDNIDDESIVNLKEQVNFINHKLIVLFPELINHLNDRPIIIKVLKCIQRFALLKDIHEFVDFNSVFPLFFELIYNFQDFEVVDVVFNVLENIIDHFDMKYITPLIEPSIALLAHAVQRYGTNPGQDSLNFDDKCRSLLYTIIENVKLVILPYHEVIYPLLANFFEPSSLVFLCEYNSLFSEDFPDLFNETTEKVLNMLNDYLNSQSYDQDDHEDIVFYTCAGFNILSKKDSFGSYALQTSTLMVEVINRDNKAKMMAFGVLATLASSFDTIMAPIFPTLLEIVSKMPFQLLIENAKDIEDKYEADINQIIMNCLIIVQSCYIAASQDENVIQLVFHVLGIVQSFAERDQQVISAAIDLLYFLELPLLLALDESGLLSEFINESVKIDSLVPVINAIKKKVGCANEEEGIPDLE